MQTFIALFRGINVGGRNLLPMKELRTILQALDLEKVKTYIQSGNVVFQSNGDNIARLPSRISAAIKESHGFEPRVLLLTLEEVQDVMGCNPFPDAVSDPKTLHLYFLADAPEDPDMEGLESIRKESERFELQGNVFYLHAPEGIGRSKLAANVERYVGVPATARNWRTVSKIVAMAEGNG